MFAHASWLLSYTCNTVKKIALEWLCFTAIALCKSFLHFGFAYHSVRNGRSGNKCYGVLPSTSHCCKHTSTRYQQDTKKLAQCYHSGPSYLKWAISNQRVTCRHRCKAQPTASMLHANVWQSVQQIRKWSRNWNIEDRAMKEMVQQWIDKSMILRSSVFQSSRPD